MKCGSIVKYKMYGKKKPVRKPCMWATPYHQFVEGWTQKTIEDREGPGDIEICDGELSVKIEAVDEPDWGGHSARLEVEIKCKKCGALHQSFNQSEYLSRLVEILLNDADTNWQTLLQKQADAKKAYNTMIKENYERIAKQEAQQKVNQK